jgi:hypothetical protein
MMYSSGLKKWPLPVHSHCQTPYLFLNEIMKNQVCSMTKNVDATLVFSLYNKYKEGKNLF